MVTELTIMKIFYFSSYTCCFPFIQKGLEFKFSRKRFYFDVLMVFGLSVEIIIMATNFPLEQNAPFLLNVLDIFFTLCINTLPFTAFVYSCLKISALNEFIRTIHSVDMALLKIEISPYSGAATSKHRMTIYCIIYFVMVCSDATCLFSEDYNWINPFQFQYYYIPLLPIIAVVDQTVSLTNLLLRRFSIITKCLAKNANAGYSFLMETLVVAHDNLTDASTLLNYYYEHQVVNIFLISMCAQLYIYFGIMQFYKSQNSLMARTFYTINLLSWILLYTIFTWHIISPVAMVVKQAKDFDILLYQIMLEDKSSKLIHNKRLRFHIAMKRDVEFLPCGLFKVDYPLLHSMVAAVTTYLIILIQFGTPTASTDLSGFSFSGNIRNVTDATPTL